MIAVLLLGAYAFTGLRYLEILPFGALAAFVIVWHTVLFASPGIIDGFARESKSKSYRRSLLGGVDSGMISARLEDLMQDEKLYCDEDLSLERLAAHLSVTKNQLSELLNTVIGKNFIAYVTAFRVEEAKRLLAEEPFRSVLSVAYASGFNSKSVFYDSFKKPRGGARGSSGTGRAHRRAPQAEREARGSLTRNCAL